MRNGFVVVVLLALVLAGASCGDDHDRAESGAVRVVTFNTGTTDGLAHDALPDDGYGSEQAAIADAWYGNGLAWQPVVDDVRRFLAEIQPDIVAFQEIFHTEDCAGIPESTRQGWVCETWSEGGPTVAQQVLGAGYRVACHPGKPDKCLGVRRGFARIRGCPGDLCLDGLEGTNIPGCGSGARVARAVLDLATGDALTVVSVHGTSGFSGDDVACREMQFAQVFVDLGDGSGMPAANGEQNLVLGDFNTDPARAAPIDASARALAAATGDGSRFHFVSPVGASVPPTYAKLFNIDHVISDTFVGSCDSPGLDGSDSAVTSITYFDHLPLVCDLVPRVDQAP